MNLPTGKATVSDFWWKSMSELPIIVLEGYALLNVLEPFKRDLSGKRVDAHVANQVIIKAWNNEGCKSRDVNNVIKVLFDFTLKMI